MSSVLQPWVSVLPWKLQSILFSSLRGPDQEYLINIKQVSKWMRSVTQHNADPSKPYMNNIELPHVASLYKELEHCPCHFVHHFLDGLAIIAYCHPSDEVSAYAARVHYHCAEELFHFVPEAAEVFWMRHRDKRGGEDPAKQAWKEHEVAAKETFMQGVRSLRVILRRQPPVTWIQVGGDVIVGDAISAYHQIHGTVSYHCPNCGGPLAPTEAERTNPCPHCKVKT